MGDQRATFLVTGAAGYIGAVLVAQLLKDGHRVVAVDNFMYNQTPLLDCCHYNNLTVVRADARDKFLISKIIKKADIILPLACLTGAPVCEKYKHEARSIIVDSIKVILKLRSPQQRIIYPTTNSGYGIGQQGIYCNEKTPLKPISLYGKLKVLAEEMLLDSGNCITLRLATCFGISPRMRIDLLVNNFVYRAINDRFIVLFQAHFMRNYIHVRDVAAAFLHSFRNFKKMKNQPYNVGLSNANLSKWELCQQIKKQIPDLFFIESKIGEDPDKRNYIVSNEKIEKTGFQAKVSLQEGISELIKGYTIVRRNQYSNV